jgi:prepilin-type N-terminal cleavage/methylation domain-containing protein
MKAPQTKPFQSGFSLVELTIVLIIVALLSTGLIFGMSAQRSVAENSDAQHQLEGIREALLGYVIVNGRLPCPAPANLPNTDASSGVAPAPPCDKTLQHGVLPWKTLGLAETDPWGNRFTYFASSRDNSLTPVESFTNALTAGALASFTINTPGNANIKDNAAAAANIASDLPAVVVSHGKNPASAWQTSGVQLPASANADERENADADTTFVSRIPSETFDDLVIWIIPSILKSRMVAAGRLP